MLKITNMNEKVKNKRFSAGQNKNFTKGKHLTEDKCTIVYDLF